MGLLPVRSADPVDRPGERVGIELQLDLFAVPRHLRAGAKALLDGARQRFRLTSLSVHQIDPVRWLVKASNPAQQVLAIGVRREPVQRLNLELPRRSH